MPPIPPFTCKSTLTAPQARLVALMQQVNYGRIEDLLVRNGQPQFDPPPRVIRQIKFGGENGPRPEADMLDFALKAEVRQLLACLVSLDEGEIQSIEVQRGLPFRMTIEQGVP